MRFIFDMEEAVVPANTNFSSVYNAAKQSLWTIHMLLAVHLVASLAIFQVRQLWFNGDTAPQRPLRAKVKKKTSRVRKTSSTMQLVRRKNGWHWVLAENPMCLLITVLIILRCIFIQVEFAQGDDEGNAVVCSWFKNAFTALGAIGNLGIYLLLWARQWSLYNSNALKNLLTTKVKVASYVVLALLVAKVVGVYSLYYVGYQLANVTPNGCLYTDAMVGVKQINIGLGVFVFGSVVIQVSLLLLTIYPLQQQYGKWCCCRWKAEGANRSMTKVQMVIRRVSVSCAVCIVNDCTLAIAIGVYAGATKRLNSFILMFYNIKLLLSLLAVVASFADWRERILPFLRRPELARAGPGRSGAAEPSAIERATSETCTRTPEKLGKNRVVVAPTSDKVVAESTKPDSLPESYFRERMWNSSPAPYECNV